MGDELLRPLELLEDFLRDGEPVSEQFVHDLSKVVDGGGSEMLVARECGEVLGVAVLAFHLNISVGGLITSIEELYVRPEARRRGVGKALLEAVGVRCVERDVSYVEVEVVDHVAKDFYAANGFEVEGDVAVFSKSYPLPGLTG